MTLSLKKGIINNVSFIVQILFQKGNVCFPCCTSKKVKTFESFSAEKTADTCLAPLTEVLKQIQIFVFDGLIYTAINDFHYFNDYFELQKPLETNTELQMYNVKVISTE